MQSVTLEDAKQNLSRLIGQVLADAEPRIVVTASGEQVVLMPLDQFSAWTETEYLLANPANAAHLRQGIAEVASNQVEDKKLATE